MWSNTFGHLAMFAGIFAGLWLIKKGIRWFGPAIKLFGMKPWK